MYLLEVKSYLDSPGVVYEEVAIEQEEQSGRYKLLTSKNYRAVLEARLKADWVKAGYIGSDTVISYGLIAGNIYRNREAELQQYFDSKNRLVWRQSLFKKQILALAAKGHENNAVLIRTKILTRRLGLTCVQMNIGWMGRCGSNCRFS